MNWEQFWYNNFTNELPTWFAYPAVSLMCLAVLWACVDIVVNPR